MTQELLDMVDEARRGEPRTQWIRRAIAEQLRMSGAEVAVELVNPPDQTGTKRGRPRKITYEPKEQPAARAAEEPPPKPKTVIVRGKVREKIGPDVRYVEIDEKGNVTPIYDADEEKEAG